jgi:hypothetical protein
MKKRISDKDWKWFGNAAHFICGNNCRFHMATVVGDYLVSTVGQLWSSRGSREIHAQVHDPAWLSENQHLRGDHFDHAYMQKFGYEDIGCDRKFETMVFKAGKICIAKGCDCGLPTIEGSELDFNGYNTAGEATRGHMELCRKWALRRSGEVRG